jgi:hypothetical protein
MANNENINEKFLRHVDNGNVDRVIDNAENLDIPPYYIDLAIRKCIKKISIPKIDDVFYKLFTVLIKKCNINFQSKENNDTTLLMLVCRKGEVVLLDEILKAKKPNLKLTDLSNNNAFHYIITSNTEEIAESFLDKLLQYDPDFNLTSAAFKSLIDCASKHGFTRVTSKLYEIKTINSINLFDTNESFEVDSKILIKFNEEFFKKEWNLLVKSYYTSKYPGLFENFREEEPFYLKAFFEYFQKSFSSDNFCYDRLNYDYNYCVFLYKLGKLPSVIQIYKDIIKYVSEDNFYIFFNLSLIILEISLHYRESILFDTVHDLLSKKLDKIEFNSSKLKKFNIYLEKINFINIYNKKERINEAQNILSFMKFYYYLTFNKLDRKVINPYLNYRENNYNQLYYYMKIRLHYLYKETDKCKEKLAMLIDYYNKENEIVLYYNNTNGIISLREKNFTLAEFYFKQCMSIFNKMKRNDPFSTILVYEKYLKYNLGITYFYQKKYELAISTLKPLVSDLGFLPYIYYRLGISFIELHLDDIKKQNSSKLNRTYERVGLIDKSKQTYIVLNSSKVINQNTSDSLEKVKEALYYFTQLAIFFEMDRPTYFTEINEMISRKLREEISSQIKVEENLSQNYKNIEELKINTYFNIIFCLLIMRDFTQIEIFFTKLENLSLDTEGKIKFLFYKLEVYIHLNKREQCLSTIDLIMEIEKANNYLLFDSSFVGSIDSNLYTNSKYKMVFYVNLVKFHLNQKHFNQAEKALSNIISLGKFNEYPAYVINIFIYYYLIKGRNDIALRILKTRKLGNLSL